MEKNVYVFDPTVADKQSRVRGVGRYLQIMKENLSDKFTFYSEKTIPYESILINPFFNLYQPSFSLKKIARRQIAIIHDVIPLKFPQHFPIGIRGRITFFLNKLSLKNYDLIITESETRKKDIIDFLQIPPEKIKIINPTLPKLFFRTDRACPVSTSTDNYCIYVGDATWNKNLVNLVRAIKLADAKCIFVGKVFENKDNLNHPWQKELKGFYTEIKNDNRFVLKGFVSDQELIELYQKANCNILISQDEGFGFSYLEALSQNCPSLLSDLPIFHETATEAGIFVDQNQPQLVAQKIIQIRDNKELQQQLLINKKNAMLKFSPEQFTKSWIEAVSTNLK